MLSQRIIEFLYIKSELISTSYIKETDFCSAIQKRSQEYPHLTLEFDAIFISLKIRSHFRRTENSESCNTCSVAWYPFLSTMIWQKNKKSMFCTIGSYKSRKSSWGFTPAIWRIFFVNFFFISISSRIVKTIKKNIEKFPKTQ